MNEHTKGGNGGNGLSDMSRGGVPLPMLIAFIGVLGTGMASFYGLNARQERFDADLKAEKELNVVRGQLVKEQIENSGLRNSAFLLSQQLAECNGGPRTGRGR